MFTDFNRKFSLNYSEVPEDYNISEIQFVFDFIYLVHKLDSGIDSAVRSVAFEYDLSQEYLWDYLIDNKYILNRPNKVQFSKQVEKFSTKFLKNILRSNGFSTSGRRKRIVERIFDNNLLGMEYYLSSKSRVFYKNKKRRFDIFNSLPKDYFYFNEFNEFYMNNFRKKVDKISISFVELFIDKAVCDNDHLLFVAANNVLAEFFQVRKNYKKMLSYVLSVYCIDLNPIWKVDDLNNHYGLSFDNYNCLLFLFSKLGKNRVISSFFVVWDSFNFEKIIVSKYSAYRCLKDIVHYKSYSKISDSLNDEFYSNDDLKVKKIVQKTLFDF